MGVCFSKVASVTQFFGDPHIRRRHMFAAENKFKQRDQRASTWKRPRIHSVEDDSNHFYAMPPGVPHDRRNDDDEDDFFFAAIEKGHKTRTASALSRADPETDFVAAPSKYPGRTTTEEEIDQPVTDKERADFNPQSLKGKKFEVGNALPRPVVCDRHRKKIILISCKNKQTKWRCDEKWDPNIKNGTCWIEKATVNDWIDGKLYSLFSPLRCDDQFPGYYRQIESPLATLCKIAMNPPFAPSNSKTIAVMESYKPSSVEEWLCQKLRGAGALRTWYPSPWIKYANAEDIYFTCGKWITENGQKLKIERDSSIYIPQANLFRPQSVQNIVMRTLERIQKRLDDAVDDKARNIYQRQLNLVEEKYPLVVHGEHPDTDYFVSLPMHGGSNQEDFPMYGSHVRDWLLDGKCEWIALFLARDVSRIHMDLFRTDIRNLMMMTESAGRDAARPSDASLDEGGLCYTNDLLHLCFFSRARLKHFVLNEYLELPEDYDGMSVKEQDAILDLHPLVHRPDFPPEWSRHCSIRFAMIPASVMLELANTIAKSRSDVFPLKLSP